MSMNLPNVKQIGGHCKTVNDIAYFNCYMASGESLLSIVILSQIFTRAVQSCNDSILQLLCLLI